MHRPRPESSGERVISGTLKYDLLSLCPGIRSRSRLPTHCLSGSDTAEAFLFAKDGTIASKLAEFYIGAAASTTAVHQTMFLQHAQESNLTNTLWVTYPFTAVTTMHKSPCGIRFGTSSRTAVSLKHAQRHLAYSSCQRRIIGSRKKTCELR